MDSVNNNISSIKRSDLTENKKLLSIIIVNYNSGEFLSRTVKSILDSNYPTDRIDLIIVDNNSQDNSLGDFQKSLMNRLTNLFNLVIIRNAENEGWCKAINAGLVRTQGDIII